MKLLLIACLVLPALAIENAQFIVNGGNVASMSTHCYQLSMRNGGGHSCGASLLSSSKAVTAAHCVDGVSTGSLSIAAGSTNRFDNGNTVSVSSYVKNPSFTNSGLTGYPNDVATLHFSGSLSTANSGICTIGMSSSKPAAGTTCTISGWGRTCGTCGLPTTLQTAQIDVISNTACQSAWSVAQINNNYHVCVQDPRVLNKAGACMGDSGGPLKCGSTVAGATSWGRSDCNTSYPSVYANLAYYRTWINSN